MTVSCSSTPPGFPAEAAAERRPCDGHRPRLLDVRACGRRIRAPRRPWGRYGGRMLLDGRRILVTGVLTESSIAFHVARRAQEEGAELLLTGFGRGLRITRRIAQRLPTPADVLELDVNDPEHLEAVGATVAERWGRLDGLVHAIAFIPGDALGGNFMSAPADSALEGFRTSAFSYKALAAALLPQLERADGGASIVGLDFDASVAWPVYDWAGVA